MLGVFVLLNDGVKIGMRIELHNVIFEHYD